MMCEGDVVRVLLGQRSYPCEIERISSDGTLMIHAPRSEKGHRVPLMGMEMVQVLFDCEDGRYTFIGQAAPFAVDTILISPQSETALEAGTTENPEDMDFDLSLL